MKNNECQPMEAAFTECYRKYSNDHPAIREAACLKVQYSEILGEIEENDLFAGRVNFKPIGFSTENAGYAYYINKKAMQKYVESDSFSPEYKRMMSDIADFWEKENTNHKLRSAYPEEMQNALPSDNWQEDSGIAFPLYRMAGGYLNYVKLLELGLPGMIQEIKKYKQKAECENGDVKLFEGMLLALGVLTDACLYYADMANKKALACPAVDRKAELLEMSAVLRKITFSKPETLREAIQLYWLYITLADVYNYGRMDIYLGDFYAEDIAAGRITEEDALALFISLWRLMADKKTTFEGRVIIGGLGRPNEANADKIALLAMEATQAVMEIEPQLTLRIYKGMNPLLMEKALDMLGEGRTFPILYNDDVNVPAVMKAFNVTYDEALRYLPYGCGEYVLEGLSFGTPSGVINLLKAMEVTLHNGRDPLTGRIIGLQLGEISEFDSFEKFFDAYKKQVEYFVDILADQEYLEYKVTGENAPFLFMSMLYDDCLQRGRAMFDGGLKYLGGTIETYGNINTSDSLTAIKELVYDKKIMSLGEMVASLDKDFEGFEHLRRHMLDASKYGNDNDAADSMAVEVHNHVCNSARSQKFRTKLDSYLVVIINNHANTILGRSTGASPDGRKSGKPMANANNPSGGSDKNGVTAFLNSLVKLDPSIHAGAVQNMKFGKSLFKNSRDKVKSLLTTYFEKGGAQAMITVVSRGDLENALREPEKYSNVFVRVGGFSARFIDLMPDVQQEVLSRTLY